uniref:NR LBD domain-containing protein n=1 Tax=Romanomermis culicivorax TaxID=13658 RepID=A0A915L156_ROMCU
MDEKGSDDGALDFSSTSSVAGSLAEEEKHHHNHDSEGHESDTPALQKKIKFEAITVHKAMQKGMLVSVNSPIFSPLHAAHPSATANGVQDGGQQQGRQKRSGSASPALTCVVCNDVSSGKHYGILASPSGRGPDSIDRHSINEETATLKHSPSSSNSGGNANGSGVGDFCARRRDSSSSLYSPSKSAAGPTVEGRGANGCYKDGGDSPSSAAVASSLTSNDADAFYDTSARLLYMAVKWAKNLPSFTSSSYKDQVILLEENWSDLFLLSLFQWSSNMENCPLLLSPPCLNHSTTTPVAQTSNSQHFETDLRYLNDLFNRFHCLTLSSAEFACLKAVVLFRPGLKDAQQIEYLQDQALNMLAQHVRVQHQPIFPLRFGKLLTLIVSLKLMNSSKIESIFFDKTTANKPMEKLLCDMYKN